MIYNVQQVGQNTLLLNETIPIGQVLLVVLYVPCNNTSTNINGNKKAIFTITRCNGMVEVNFEGVASFYEDLLSGLVYFSAKGTWKANLYYQESTSSVDVNLATFVTTIELQVV